MGVAWPNEGHSMDKENLGAENGTDMKGIKKKERKK